MHARTPTHMRRQTAINIAIVILFALLHFAVAWVSGTLHYYDDIPLTLLTITMVVIVAMRNNTRIDVMAILTLVATLFGFIVGSWIWVPIDILFNNEVLSHAISTLIITSVAGVSIDSATRRVKRFNAGTETWRLSSLKVLGIAIAILVLRMGYILIFPSDSNSDSALIISTLDIISNTWALLVLIVGNILLAIRLERYRTHHPTHKSSIVTILLWSIVIVVIATTLSYYNIPQFTPRDFSPFDILRLLSASLIIDILMVTICLIAQILTSSKRELRVEREQKHRAEYQYDRLKQQINPHFLFNSLGILDYLVQEQHTERASNFIRKLASIYRYMLNNDSEPLVRLADEMEFTTMYIDLLKERFVDGLIIEQNIDEQDLERFVVPCALQLLVENATKHNIVEAEMPLHITIAIEDDMLVVRNNLQLRRHGQPSTRLGLENIRQQYLDITNRDIVVIKSENEFIVKLPII